MNKSNVQSSIYSMLFVQGTVGRMLNVYVIAWLCIRELWKDKHISWHCYLVGRELGTWRTGRETSQLIHCCHLLSFELWEFSASLSTSSSTVPLQTNSDLLKNLLARITYILWIKIIFRYMYCKYLLHSIACTVLSFVLNFHVLHLRTPAYQPFPFGLVLFCVLLKRISPSHGHNITLLFSRVVPFTVRCSLELFFWSEVEVKAHYPPPTPLLSFKWSSTIYLK